LFIRYAECLHLGIWGQTKEERRQTEHELKYEPIFRPYNAHFTIEMMRLRKMAHTIGASSFGAFVRRSC
jgi:hypothetical protein